MQGVGSCTRGEFEEPIIPCMQRTTQEMECTLNFETRADIPRNEKRIQMPPLPATHTKNCFNF